MSDLQTHQDKRKLQVGIGDTLRESGHILRSVSQGSVL